VEKRPFHLDQMLGLTPVREDTATVSTALEDYTATFEAMQWSIAFRAAQLRHALADPAHPRLLHTIGM